MASSLAKTVGQTMGQMFDYVGSNTYATITGSWTRDSDKHIACVDPKNQQTLDTFRIGTGSSLDGDFKLLIGTERYTLSKTATTIGAFGKFEANVPLATESAKSSTLSFDGGLMHGTNKFDKKNGTYFDHTRSDLYVKGGIHVEAKDNDNVSANAFVGVDRWYGCINSFARMDIKKIYGQFKPSFSIGVSFNEEYYIPSTKKSSTPIVKTETS